MSEAPSHADLASGISALAQETPNRQLRRSLRKLASALATGQPLDAAATALPNPPPAYLITLLAAAPQHGGYSLTLAQVVAGQDRARRVWRSAVQAMIYPLALVFASAALLVLFGWEVITPLMEMLQEYDVKLPAHAERLQLTAIWAGGIALAALVSGMLIAAAARIVGGRTGWSTFLTWLPLVGLTYHWAGVVEWLDLLRLLVEAGAALPRALRESGAGLNDRYLGAASNRLANLVEQGLPLSQAVARDDSLPMLLVPFLRSGENRGSLPAALANAAELFIGRSQLRSQWLERGVPLAVVILVSLLLTWIVTGVYLPMMTLIQGLSGGGPGMGGGAPNVSQGLDPLRLAILAIPGVALLIARRSLRRGDSLAGPLVDRLLSTIGWVLIGAAVLGLMVGTTGGLALVPFVIGAVFAIDAYIHFRQSEHRSLLLAVAAAIDRQVPLPDALFALADERGGSLLPVARRLAELLEAGRPLPEAAREARLWLTPDLRVALAWAGKTGLISDVLQTALRNERTSTRQLRQVINALAYPFILIVVGTGVLSFIMLQIVPVFKKMFEEFELKLPGPTILLIELANYAIDSYLALLGLLLFPVGVLCGAALFFDVNLLWSARLFPPLRWLMRRHFGAQALCLLAVAVRRGFPLVVALENLAEVHPIGFVRQCLQNCVREISSGRPPWDALRRYRFIGAGEAGVLSAAERVGNLPWALEEMADGILRRQLTRVRAWYNVVVPLFVLALGVCVGYIMIALLMPLVALIQGLSGR